MFKAYIQQLLICLCLVLVPFFGTAQPAEKACFSVPGGFYEESFELELFPFYANHHIRFTTNGNRPTAQSTLYTGPLTLDEHLYSTSDIYTIQVAPDDLMVYPDSVGHCIVIRAAVFDENDSCLSEVATNSYFIRALGCDTHGLPVVSLCADTLDLFDYDRGILVPGVWFNPEDPNVTGNYYQRGIEWERVANVEYYDFDNTGVNQIAGLRTHGGNGRRYPQKCLCVYARGEYGKSHFEHRFFPTLPNDKFKRLVFKPFSSSWIASGVADYLCNRMAEPLNVESLASSPVVLFLNGEYWGVYFVHEKPDEHFLEEHLGVDPESLNLINGWGSHVEQGNCNEYLSFRAWLEDADLTLPENWEWVCEHVDIPCFIDYIIFELFIENADWPANNVRLWYLQGGPLRWIFFDGDACMRYGNFDVLANATYVGPDYWPSSTPATLFFRKFLENRLFEEAFVNRFNELLDSSFDFSVTSSFVDSIQTTLEGEVPLQSARFQFPSSMEQWNYCVGLHVFFLAHRAEAMRELIHHIVSVQENTASTKVYPNPSDGLITVEIADGSEGATLLRISDLLGREVYQQRVTLEGGSNVITVDPHLSPGVYILKINNFVTKIVRK